MEAVGAGMEVVAAFIGRQADGHVAEGEAAAADAVGVAAHGSAQEGAARSAVAVGIVIAQHHVGDFSLGIGNEQLHQGGAVVTDGGGELTTGYGIQEGFFAGGQNAESFFHKQAPFDFYGKSVGIMLRSTFLIILYSRRYFKPFFHFPRKKDNFFRRLTESDTSIYSAFFP